MSHAYASDSVPLATLVVVVEETRLSDCLALLERAGFQALIAPALLPLAPTGSAIPPRLDRSPSDERYRFGDVELDVGNYDMMRGGRRITLSATERAILVTLARARGRLVQRRVLQRLLASSLGQRGESHSLRSHVANLRRKLEREPSQPRLLITVWGRGYRLDGVTPVIGDQD
jgi:DNA-binding response OmpR family regulator